MKQKKIKPEVEQCFSCCDFFSDLKVYKNQKSFFVILSEGLLRRVFFFFVNLRYASLLSLTKKKNVSKYDKKYFTNVFSPHSGHYVIIRRFDLIRNSFP
ncbi:MAG: hypothetical protein A2W11_01825 [Ignavibacteria bacterium RBG_16_35_7]|nr:MAG: hypothetical protein A2W11_01825 [Ignavibacteria bacterium RBG_16_35_7]